MDYSYKAIVDRIRDDSISYIGLNWENSDSPVTKYPNLVAWIDAHGKCDGAFRIVRDAAQISSGVLMKVIVEGLELPPVRLEAICARIHWDIDTMKNSVLLNTGDEFVPELLAKEYERCFNECASYNQNWLNDWKAVSIYYDLKRGIYPPMIYWEYMIYVIGRNKRYRSV